MSRRLPSRRISAVEMQFIGIVREKVGTAAADVVAQRFRREIESIYNVLDPHMCAQITALARKKNIVL